MVFRLYAAILILTLCGVSALAESVVFRSPNSALEVSGRFLDFDGTNVTLLTSQGPVTFLSDGLNCEGPCPDLEAYVPYARIVGEERIGSILLPALAEVYARDSGLTYIQDGQSIRVQSQGGNDGFQIDFIAALPEDAIATFTGHDAHGLISMRELRESEILAARASGLGNITLAPQARILALDALIPVTSPVSSLSEISLLEIEAAFSGRTDHFSLLLPKQPSGQIQGFQDRILQQVEASSSEVGARYDDPATLITSIIETDNSLSLMPLGEIGAAKPLTLIDECGQRTAANPLSVKTEDYPLTFPIFLYLPQRHQHANLRAFWDWLRSPQAQLVIRRVGLIDLAAVPIPLSDQGDRLAGAIANAGEEVSLEALQHMVETLRSRQRISSTFRFQPGSSELDGQSRSNVMQLAQSIRDGQFAGKELTFIGFSDGLGSADANLSLSFERANTVLRHVTTALGNIVPETILLNYHAFGEALPMACDDTIWGQQTNRRVELWIRDITPESEPSSTNE